MLNWNWIKKYYGWIALILGVVFIIVKIDLWANGTDKSTFLIVISPFIKDVVMGGLIFVFFILL